MISIRRRLLSSLLIGMIVIASGTGFLIYRHVQGELDELYNATIKQLAIYIVHEWQGLKPPIRRSFPLNLSTQSQWEEQDFLLQLWDRKGTLLAEDRPVATTTTIPLYKRQGLHRTTIDGEVWRVYRADATNIIVQVAQPESARHETITETSTQLLLPLILQIPLLILLAWLSVQHGLKPLQSLSRTIARKQPETLTAIDDREQPRELQPLVATLNDLLQRLDEALEQQRRFVADAAHELRTPIATLQLQLDWLQRAQSDRDREQAIEQLRSGMQRATHLARQLLSIASAESSTEHPQNHCVDLAALVKEVIERHLPAARASRLDLGVTRLDAAIIHCPRKDIETVLDNLVNNAIRYTPSGGRIDITVAGGEQHATIEVSDSGPGIPMAQRSLIFNRFYRGLLNPSTPNQIEGSGLGLAIVKAICDRYRAEIRIDDGDGGRGARFTLRWPVRARA